MNECNHRVLDNIYNTDQSRFYWIMFQKMNPNINLSENLKKINTINSKYFQIIESKEKWTYADPFLFCFNNELYVFFEVLNTTRIKNKTPAHRCSAAAVTTSRNKNRNN